MLLTTKGPLLIIANHPNSFLDAIFIGAQYKRKIYFLARGDIFKNKIFGYLLRSLNMIPIYRQREGKENLYLNEFTFKETTRLISNGEAILIFIEGICLNTNTLLPFKKGTARIIEEINKLNIHLNIHLAGISYNNFKGPKKRINLIISKYDLKHKIENAKDRIDFNKNIFDLLNNNIKMVKTIEASKHKNAAFVFLQKLSHFLIYPFYTLIESFVNKKTKGTVFYDSVLFGILFFTFPLYLCLLYFVFSQFQLSPPYILTILVLLPLIHKYTHDR